MTVPASRNFIGVPIDNSWDSVYPRIAKVQLDGSYQCNIVLDHIVRLVGYCRRVLDTDTLPQSPELSSVYPFTFPFFVKGLDTHQRVTMGLEPYVTGIKVMT